ncbi:energy transducer TonB family protein [Acinetobacter rathckeae]|uniref:energy transducer TonB family protein n=1 Tax=Acinetobacter rathckeae TaxID=2605272 RepID=UPI0018A2B669|nr:energy transducer TonB [Acinetobacter rathckeae]MBF7689018.1 energy transducer TonB [Acinetobacter rathckeae]MBF7696538.1 energy transducer TonB [Acinetobacter rathckeae]
MSMIEKDRQLSRWFVSFIIVMLIYIIAIYWLLKGSEVATIIIPQKPQAVMLELTQLPPTVKDSKPSSLPVGELKQEQHQSLSNPKATVAKPTVFLEPVVSKKAEVIIPKPSKVSSRSVPVEELNSEDIQENKNTPKKNNEINQKEVDQTSAPPSNHAIRDEKSAANQNLSGESLQKITLSWQLMVLSRLEQFKRYPRKSQFNRQEGVAVVHYIVNRKGEVLSVHLIESSGFKDLDDEALFAVKRASPLPPPPEDVKGNPLELSTPIKFSLVIR